MNLEVDGTQKILLVEESQGLSLHTDSQRFAVAIGGLPVLAKGDKGDQGDIGPQGPSGIIEATYPLIYQPGIGTGGSISADIGTGASQLIIGSNPKLFDERTPLDNSITDAKISGTLSQSKIANLVSDLSAINSSLSNKSNIGHTHSASDINSGIFNISRLPVATSGSSSSTQVVRADDSRLSNTRTPTDGTVTNEKIASTLSPDKITGTASVVGHKHSGSDIDSGTISISVLPTGSTDSTIALGNHTHTTFSNYVTFNNGISINNKKINNVDAPVADSDAANKAYVDRVAVGLNVRSAVDYTTTDTIVLSGITNQSGKIDSSGNLAVGNRVLVKNQGDAKDNGIYVVASGDWSRADDMIGTGITNWRKWVVGAYVFVNQGVTQANTAWVANVTNEGNESIGTTLIPFNQFSSVSITGAANNAVSVTGNAISVIGSKSISVNGSISVIPKTSGGLAIDNDNGGLYISSVTNSMLAGGIDLTSKVTNALPIGNGGTGATTLGGAKVALEINNINNTSDANKPILGDVTGTLGASLIKSDVVLRGNPTTDTSPSTDDKTKKVATTEWVLDQVDITNNPLMNGAASVGSGKRFALSNHVHPTDTTREAIANKGVANGYAGLDSSAKVPIGQLPTGTTSSTISTGNHAHVIRTSHNFMIQGNIVTSAALAIPPFFATLAFPANAGIGQTTGTMNLVKIYFKTATGQVTFQILQNATAQQINPNGSTVDAKTKLTATVTGGNTGDDLVNTPIAIGDGNSIELFIPTGDGISGSPQNLSVTLVFEHKLN